MQSEIVTKRIACPDCGVVQETECHKWSVGGGQGYGTEPQGDCAVCGAALDREDNE